MRRIISLLLVLASISATAQDFKILFVNTGTIRVGGKNLAKGDCFKESDKIAWSNDKQAIRVQSLTDNKQYVLSARDFKQRGLSSSKDYLVRTNRLSTRGSGSLYSVARQIGETIYILDSARVSINYRPYESEYFFLLLGNERHLLEMEDDQLVFDSSVFKGQEPLEADLYYHYADGKEECVVEGLSLVWLPKSASRKKKK